MSTFPKLQPHSSILDIHINKSSPLSLDTLLAVHQLQPLLLANYYRLVQNYVLIMADKRRLNAEVDKTLKKVEEGKDAFDTLLAKFEQATSLSQREKHGEDLKKEIKKLQRLRDSIKQWQGNPDIKDREALTRSRRDIEVRMEEFKNVERENKSKPYSKEGIMGTPGEPFDPSERTRIQMVRFLEERIDEIETRQKQADVDTDAIKSGKKTSHAGANDDGSGDDDDADEDTKSAARSRKDRRKKKKDGKKSSSRSVTKSTTRDGSSQRNGGGADGEGSENGKKDDQGVQLSPEDVIRVEDLQEQSEKLKSHARNLKVLIRQLDNGTLEADILNDLKDELEAFIVRLDEAHELAEINPLESTVQIVRKNDQDCMVARNCPYCPKNSFFFQQIAFLP